MLLSCGLTDGGQNSSKGADSIPVAAPERAEQVPPVVSAVPSSAATPAGAQQAQPMVSAVSRPVAAPVSYYGPTSLEERILASPVIARVRLDSATSTVESGTASDGTTKYIALLEFNFSVLEYLKGSGLTDIVAVWESRPVFDTRQEAEAALPAVVAARDTQWDDREAIVFLQDSQTYLASTQQASRYYLSWEHEIDVSDDKYSLASRHNKLWLPAEAAAGAPSQLTGDQQRFLTDVPPATGTAPTITLGQIKTRIAAVTAKLNAGDGSQGYTECVRRTYRTHRSNGYFMATRGKGIYLETPDHELGSGLAAATVVYESSDLGGLPNKRDELWLDGGDAKLFSVEFGDSVPYDFSGDGVTDSIQYAQRVVSARPLPAGVYSFHFNHRDVDLVPCGGFAYRYEWMVTVTAPEGTLHEAFFDPVTDGSTVAADSTNGVIKPAEFTDANGASATIKRIAWEAGTGESGTVKLKLSPHNGIAGHTLHFIALDGSVPLSLKVADATVDSANDTLSWTVASQPWNDGDKLMLRIR